jgi:hypothetical protein
VEQFSYLRDGLQDGKIWRRLSGKSTARLR